MSNRDAHLSFGPTRAAQRIAAIDRMRGFGVLGLAYMWASAYGLQHAAFYRLEIDSDSASDWIAGIVGFLAFDLKASALVMLVFGAGIAHLLDRAEHHGRHPKRFLLWRIALLFAIGIPPGVHAPLWEGNYHLFTAFWALATLPLFRRKATTQMAVGISLVVLALALTPLFQWSFAADGLGLSQYWWPDTHPYFDQQPIPDNHPTGYFIVTISLRVIGTSLIGSALYRYGIIQGEREPAFYRKLAFYGFATGIPLAAGSILWMYLADYEPTVALIGHIPNAASAVPIALGYLSLIILWSQTDERGGAGFLRNGVEAVGRMSLTNSVALVIAGTFIIRDQFGRNYFSRTDLALIVIVVSLAQMHGSSLWLKRFEYGPLEWLLRAITYRRLPTQKRLAS